MTESSDDTRKSLLLRIRDPNDTRAWNEFYDLYAPLVYGYARGLGLGHDDAEDVRGACLEAVTRQISDFDYDKSKGGFKAWLRTIARRRAVDLLRKRRMPIAETHQLREAPAQADAADALWEQQWRQQHLRYCVDQVGQEHPGPAFDAFQLLVSDECSVAEVAERFGWSSNQVYKAKSTVLRRVRAKMAALYSELGGLGV
ncbi:MAG: sigma-70 family RNA polymerase sigma factor [Planctomycetota bacterium]